MRFRVILHEGVVPEESRAALAAGLGAAYARLFGGAPADVGVDFTVMPRGRFFTAGELSTSSIVAGTVPAGTPDERRQRLLADVTSLWCDVTGCTPHQVVVTAADARA